MTKMSLAQQIEEVDRELALRARTYPIEVAKGKMRKSVSDYQVARLDAVRRTLAWLRDNEATIKHRLGDE
jgi:hypothetical protein